MRQSTTVPNTSKMNASTSFKEPRPLDLTFDCDVVCMLLSLAVKLTSDSVSLFYEIETFFSLFAADDSVVLELEIFLLHQGYLTRILVPEIDSVGVEGLFFLRPLLLRISSDSSERSRWNLWQLNL